MALRVELSNFIRKASKEIIGTTDLINGLKSYLISEAIKINIKDLEDKLSENFRSDEGLDMKHVNLRITYNTYLNCHFT